MKRKITRRQFLKFCGKVISAGLLFWLLPVKFSLGEDISDKTPPSKVLGGPLRPVDKTPPSKVLGGYLRPVDKFALVFKPFRRSHLYRKHNLAG